MAFIDSYLLFDPDYYLSLFYTHTHTNTQFMRQIHGNNCGQIMALEAEGWTKSIWRKVRMDEMKDERPRERF